MIKNENVNVFELICVNSINDLVDDCLWLIFGHLSLTEKVGVARVCQKWRNTMSEILAFGQPQLTFQDFKSISHPFHYRHLLSRKTEIIIRHKFFSVTCLVVKINWVTSTLVFRPVHFKSVFQQLPSLQVVELYGLRLCNDNDLDWDRMAPLGRNLKGLKARHHRGTPEAFLYHFLKNADCLQNLEVDFLDQRLIELLSNQFLKMRCLALICDVTLPNLEQILGDKTLIKRIVVKSLCLDSEEAHVGVLDRFKHFSELKTLELGLKPLDNNDIFSHRHCVLANDFQRFQSKSAVLRLNLFSLKGFEMGWLPFSQFIRRLPEITKLKLDDFKINCSCQKFPEKASKSERVRALMDPGLGPNSRFLCQQCPKSFIEQLALIRQLRVLKVGHFVGNTEALLSPLIDLIRLEQPTRLRQLQVANSGRLTRSLFEAFIEMASKCPRDSFGFYFGKNDFDKTRFIKTKNLFVKQM